MDMEPQSSSDDALALRRVARSLLRSTSDVDDVIQDAWVEAARSTSVNDDNRQAWLKGTVRILVKSELRDRARRTAREQRSARVEAVLADPSASMVRRETIEVVRNAVANLDDRQRSVVQLHFFEGLPPKDIATRTGQSVESVRRFLRLANETLKTRLVAEHEGSERLLGIALVGAFRWERSDAEGAALAAKGAASGVGLFAASKWMIAALVLVTSVFLGTRILTGSEEHPELPGMPADLEGADANEPDDLVLEVAPNGTSEAAGRVPLDTPEEPEAAKLQAPSTRTAEVDPEPLAESPTAQTFRVLDPTGAPVAGAEIVFPHPRRDIAMGMTGGDGRARVDFKGSPSFTLAALGNTAHVKVFARHPDFADSDIYFLHKADEARELITLPFTADALEITGRVVGHDGAGLRGAVIERHQHSGLDRHKGMAVRRDEEGQLVEPRSQRAVTDENGDFRLTGLPQGLHTLEVRAVGATPSNHLVEGTGLTRVTCNIELSKGSVIAGVVLSPTKEPVEGAEVVLRATNLSNAVPVVVTTDAEGKFRFEGTTVGSNNVQATFDGSRVRRSVTVREGEDRSIELRLEKIPRFQVKLEDENGEPLAGYGIVCQSVRQKWAAPSTFAGPDGTAYIESFPSEPLDLLIRSSASPMPIIIQRVEEPQVDVTYTVVSPREHLALGAAKGLLRLGGELPGPGYTVDASLVEHAITRSVPVDPVTGAFTLNALPRGEYLLTATAPNQALLSLKALEFAGVDADLGLIDAPPKGALVFDCQWPEDQASSYRVRQIFLKTPSSGGIFRTIAEGSVPPPGEIAVVPGAYGVIVSDSKGRSIQQRAVVVRPGFRQTIVLSPAGSFVATVDLTFEGQAPVELPVEIHALTIADDAELDTLSADEVAAYAATDSLRETISAQRGHADTFPISFEVTEEERWLILYEWPKGKKYGIVMPRPTSDSVLAPTIELGPAGPKTIRHWGS